MNEPRHMFVSAEFIAEYDDDKDLREHEQDDPCHPPVSRPLHWLYGKDCEKIGLLEEDWGTPEFDREFGFHLYRIEGAAYFIPEEAWQEFAEHYSYLPEYSESNIGMLGLFPDGGPMHRPGWRWCDDGNEWNSGCWTPVWDVSVSLTANEQEVRANPDHFGFEIIEEPNHTGG